jgi:ubiquinone/menaquinone biosynthesis C-methylase UbiE
VGLRVLLFLLTAIGILACVYLLTAVSTTLNRLNVVEAERDRWQRAGDVVKSLDVGQGSRVVDLGSGAGYFTLKLSDAVGAKGTVTAVDLRRLSLFFLRLRAVVGGRRNIRIIVGTPDDPLLPGGQADAVLISNTYHEFGNPSLMLDHTWRALHAGGRLVIVDRGPDSSEGAHGHEVPVERVDAELRRKGFEILSREERFIDRPGDEPWWLLVARRP